MGGTERTQERKPQPPTPGGFVSSGRSKRSEGSFAICPRPRARPATGACPYPHSWWIILVTPGGCSSHRVRLHHPPGKLLSRSNFRENYWLPAVDHAGLAPLKFHSLRHTHAGLLIAGGAHPKAVQARLGPQRHDHDHARHLRPFAPKLGRAAHRGARERLSRSRWGRNGDQ